MSQDTAAGATLVKGLLEYIEQVEKLKSKPAFSVPTEFFVAYQHELQDLPEVQFNLESDGDDVWLRIPRLPEIPAPEPDDQLKRWLTLPKSPEKTAELKSEIEVAVNKDLRQRLAIGDHPEIQDLFNWYLEFQYQPWAAAERSRRKTIQRYNQLFSLQQALSSEGAETPLELAWGIGYAAWKKEGFATAVKHPLLVQTCEVTLDEKTFDLLVRPRDVDARLEIDTYAELEIPGVRQLDAYWRAALASGANRVNPFEPSTFDGTLKAAVGHLDPSGAYEERFSDVTIPAPDDRLKVTSTWVLFGRRRAADLFLEDIRRLKKKVDEATSLPSVIRSLVERGDGEVKVRPEQPFRGLSSSDAGTGAMELFFPMPYNDEQVSIVQKLYANDGVVVQGPPGTGKTHTIANVICHYLAQGKRVLVTAKGESALAVLQDKLPEAVRPLSVSLLSDERDGMKQFEHSIQTIATRVAQINPTRTQESIAAAEAKLTHLHAKISHVDQTVAGFASRHMQSYPFQGREVSPEDLAKLVLEAADTHQWFDDEPPAAAADGLPFDDAAIASLRRSRMAVRADLKYLGVKLAKPSAFPTWPVLLGLHRDLVRAKAIDTSVSEGNILALVDSQLSTFEKAQKLIPFLDERKDLMVKLDTASQPWVKSLRTRLADLQPDDTILHALLEVCSDVQGLELERKALVAKAVTVPVDAELNPDVMEALERLVAGKSAFGFGFGKGEARKIVAAITVTGVAPVGREGWLAVQQSLVWRVEARKVLARWAAVAGEFDLEVPEPAVDAGFRKVVQWQAFVEDARTLTFQFDAPLATRLIEVFGAAANRLWDAGEPFVTGAYASLQAQVDKGRLGHALKRVQELNQLLDGCDGAITLAFRNFLALELGNEEKDESALQATFVALDAELTRLTALKPFLDEITRVTAAIEKAGASRWAKRLRTEAATEDLDPASPANWLDAWNWRQAVMLLDSIDGHHKLRELFEERKALTTALARTYQELVAEKTWLGVFQNSPDVVRQALQAYLNAVQAMGAGTGVRAVRHRKNARDAMTQAYQAVPCWVLPQWRVSETIPAEIGLFDLVIIDEASQSDIWALPALLRGKKVLVVGDHKQVSPSAVGTAEEKIKELESRFLANQPFGSEMTPDKSVYDLARVVFAGNSVMLKEHFRCVPAIIEFSNREFYGNDIRALRVPKANERLDPPLVDVFVRGGNRKGDVNEVEALAIVNEIQAIIADSAFDGRTIGVVTLLGTAQAALLHSMVSARISPVDVIARKIAIGPPPVFQGRERDIMMVSMVVGPDGRTAANRADMQQRFNVALSRARDRMYLFRSVSDTQFKEDSLNGKVLSHFKQPFRQDVRKVQALREKCESGFEFEMFDELVRRGYRVEPQVPCGGYRIDFVVEGNEGRRLAVECDGDRFHGPGQWQADMARQRVLERAGWTFWRCFASTFVRQRESVIDDLIQTLDRLGIEPLGSESVDTTAWVHYKEVDPFVVVEAAEMAAQEEAVQP